MSLRTAVGVLCALLCGVVAGPARASAIADFKAGSGVFIEHASVILDGSLYTSAGTYLAKPPGTLDLSIAASDLGIGVNASVDVQAVGVNGNFITYMFDKTFSPPLDLGDGVNLTHGWGLFVVKATLIPGSNSFLCNFQPCLRNVYLDLQPGGLLLVEGDGWSRLGNLLSMKGVAGVPQPSLSGVTLSGAQPLCSSTTDTLLPISAFITSVAPTGGAKIDFTSSYPQGLQVPPHQTINAGKSMVTFNGIVKANFQGFLTLSAYSNGAKLMKTVEIHPKDYCEGGGGGGRFLAAWVPDWLAGCIMCSRYIDQSDIYERLANVNGRLSLVKERELVDVGRALGVESLDVAALSNNGLIAGTMASTLASAPTAFRASLDFGVSRPEPLGDMTPAGINSFGAVVGYRTTPAGTVAVFHDGKQLSDLRLELGGGVLSSQATAVNDAGYVIGTFVDGDKVVHGFRFKGRTTSVLPRVGRSPAIPAAVNQKGQLAANTTDEKGNTLGLFVDENLRVREIAPPEGFNSFEVKSINRAGWIVGTASNEKETRAFLYQPGSGLVDISTLAPREQQPFEALDALRITDSNQIVVQGTLEKVTDLYLLSL